MLPIDTGTAAVEEIKRPRKAKNGTSTASLEASEKKFFTELIIGKSPMLDNILIIIGVVSALFGVPASMFSIISILTNENSINPFKLKSKYHNLYGKYKFYNLSMENNKDSDGEILIAEWDIIISKRKKGFRSPMFAGNYNNDTGNKSFDTEMRGRVYIEGETLSVAGHFYRSEERSVGKECVITFRYRWSPYH